MTQNNCLHYWDLCPILTIDAVVALWCDVEPAQLASLNYSTSCMDIKRILIEQALRDDTLECEIDGYTQTNGWVVPNPTVKEALLHDKNLIRIKKDSLRRWFLDMAIEDRPAFLFEESRINSIPDGSEVAEMNTMQALAVMALLLAESSQGSKYKTGDRPNAKVIGDTVLPLAKTFFGDDVKLASFNKKISKALEVFNELRLPQPPR